ncbi:hypothetical protein [Bdellovibrio bacteriovorus]|uniref:hypothetical protein n=1 Tax=Bdellovibrio bacteriovorus TaxID=959 RepID=UPI0035A6BFC5
MSDLKQEGKIKKVVVAGCLTQRYKDDLVEGLPEADLFVGSGEFQNIAKILKKFRSWRHEENFLQPSYLSSRGSNSTRELATGSSCLFENL